MNLLAALLLSALTTSQAVAILLNTRNATSPATYERALNHVQREAEEGKPLQQFVIGVTTTDKRLAEKYLTASRPSIREMAVKKDNPLAWYLLSVETNDFAMLQKAATGGNVQALNALGSYNVAEAMRLKKESGKTNEVERILRQSYSYFSQAAALRDANGFINLGTCYRFGYGCKKDLRMAFECFKSAAALNHPDGMEYMSACYERGDGVEKDQSLSLLWYMRARALRGDAAAEKWLKSR